MSAQTVNEMVKPQRRWDIDWLRTLAVLVLVPYHTALIFAMDEPWYVKNDQLSTALTYWFVYLLYPWGMSLLFLLSGYATWFALRFRSGSQYAKERFKRLIIPFVFGVLVITPFQSYLGLRNHSDYAESFLRFYPHFFRINPEDPLGYSMGGFTMGNLWFILFLFVFSLIALPLFLYLERESGQRVIDKLAAFFVRPGTIFLLVVPLVVMYLLLVYYPNPLYFLTCFIYGYVLAADARFEKAIDRHKTVALILGPVLMVVSMALLPTILKVAAIPGWLPMVYYYGFLPWFILLTLLGYGKRFLNFASKPLMYLGEASYPFYILHQTVSVVIGFYVVQWNASISVKYVTVAVATFVATIILYEVLVRHIGVVRSLFGMRPKQRLPETSTVAETQS